MPSRRRAGSITACSTPACPSPASWQTAYTRPPPRGNPASDLEQLLGDHALAGKVLRTYEEQRRLAAQDRKNLADLRRRLGRKPMIEVPHLDDDVHDLAGLRRMDEYLFG